jgi:pyruvate kinase
MNPDDLIQQLKHLRLGMIEAENQHVAITGNAHPRHVESQRNLLHYLVLRHHDLRPLQQELAALGLSSLGRSESHVLATINAVLAALESLCGKQSDRSIEKSAPDEFKKGSELLATHTNELLGASPL